MRKPRLTSILDYQEALDVTERGKESGIIGLALESTEPELAVKILNKISALYVEQNVQRTSAEAAQSLEFLKEQLPQVKSDLEKAGNALNAYQTRTKSVDISLETKAILDQIVSLDTAISQLKLQQAEMDRKFTRQHPAYRALLAQIGELSSKQQEAVREGPGPSFDTARTAQPEPRCRGRHGDLYAAAQQVPGTRRDASGHGG